MGAPAAERFPESPFFSLFETVAGSNPDNEVLPYENLYVSGVAIAVRHRRRAAEIVELIQWFQDSPAVLKMANLVTRLRDETDVNPRDGQQVGQHLRDFNPENRPTAYGSSFVVGLQVGLFDTKFGKEVVRQEEKISDKGALRRTQEQIYELVRRARQEAGLR